MNCKIITNFENYSISEYGKVISVNYHREKRIKQLKTSLDKDGYERVSLFKNGKRYWKKVHRLVAQAFIINPNNKPQVNHIDGIKNNNNLNNLEWCTKSENEKHKYKVLKIDHPHLGKFGKLNPNAKKISQYDLNGKFIKNWESVADVNRKLGFDISAICKVTNNKSKTAYKFIWKNGHYI